MVTGTSDPDVYLMPHMTRYLTEGVLGDYHGCISKSHLMDLVLLNHPPEYFLKRSDAGRRRLITKAMTQLNFQNWSGKAWRIP